MSKLMNQQWVKMLYKVDVCTDSYGSKRVLIVMKDDKGKRYIWSTSSDTIGCLNLIGKKKDAHFKIAFHKKDKLEDGDILIERVKVLDKVC